MERMDDDEHYFWWYLDDNIAKKVTHKLCCATSITSINTKPIRKTHYNVEQRHEEAMVCLTCTQTDCAGETACFEKRKRELKQKGEI